MGHSFISLNHIYIDDPQNQKRRGIRAQSLVLESEQTQRTKCRFIRP